MNINTTGTNAIYPTGTNAIYPWAFRNLGWECPKCGGCYAPLVAECQRCCPPVQVRVGPGTAFLTWCPNCGKLYGNAELHTCISWSAGTTGTTGTGLSGPA